MLVVYTDQEYIVSFSGQKALAMPRLVSCRGFIIPLTHPPGSVVALPTPCVYTEWKLGDKAGFATNLTLCRFIRTIP